MLLFGYKTMPLPNLPTVLVVEDDPVSRHLLQYTIERAGYTVVAAADGLQAWQRLQQGDIDLMVVDQQMPLCSGVELLNWIENRASEGQRLVSAAILCTAKGHEMDHARLHAEFGLLAVIGKPFSPRKLTQVINDHFVANTNARGDSAALGVPSKPAKPAAWTIGCRFAYPEPALSEC